MPPFMTGAASPSAIDDKSSPVFDPVSDRSRLSWGKLITFYKPLKNKLIIRSSAFMNSIMEWRPMTSLPPKTDVLVWASGCSMIGILVEGETDGEHWRVFMDPRTDELLPWPSHWAPLPSPPGIGCPD